MEEGQNTSSDLGVDHGLEETIKWYRRFYSEADTAGESMYEFSVVQTNKYVNVAHKKGILWAITGDTHS